MIIISPAKNLNTNVESFINNDFTKPLFLKKTKTFGTFKKPKSNRNKKFNECK